MRIWIFSSDEKKNGWVAVPWLVQVRNLLWRRLIETGEHGCQCELWAIMIRLTRQLKLPQARKFGQLPLYLYDNSIGLHFSSEHPWGWYWVEDERKRLPSDMSYSSSREAIRISVLGSHVHNRTAGAHGSLTLPSLRRDRANNSQHGRSCFQPNPNPATILTTMRSK